MFKVQFGLVVPLVLFVLAQTGICEAQFPRGAREGALVSAVQVRVETRWGSQRRCSGYLYSTQGLVITTYSAISDARKIQIYQADIGVLDVPRVRRIDPRANIAVLGVAQQLPGDLVIAQQGDSTALAVGDDLRVLHHAESSSAVIHECKIEALGYPQQLPECAFTKQFAQELVLYQVSGPFDAGSAGALVVDSSWNAIGILVGSSEQSGAGRTGYVLAGNYLSPLLNSSYDVQWAQLRSGKEDDAHYFDTFFGPARQLRGFQEPMSAGYIAWFGPMYPAAYKDAEFTTEINDKVKKNWFASTALEIDGVPLREISGSKVVLWQATSNPWGVTDGIDRFVNFDADSLFSKRVYKDRQTEERIMTRHILALALAPGKHFISYENKGANFKSSGIKRRNIEVSPASVQLLDIQGLSLVQMDRLPPPPPALAGEKPAVKYELTRRPLTLNEVVYGIRKGWFETN